MDSEIDTQEFRSQASAVVPEPGNAEAIVVSTVAVVFEATLGTAEEVDPTIATDEARRAYWLENGAALALGELERLRKTVLHCSHLIREDAQEEAKRCLLRSLEAFDRFLESVRSTERAHRFDPSSPLEERLRTILARSREEITSDAWHSLADRIEYELLPNLHDWGRRLRTWSEATIARWAA